MREEALLWLRAAKRDLERAARALQEGDRVSVVFWSQQAAEEGPNSAPPCD